MGRGRRTKLNKQQISEDFCIVLKIEVFHLDTCKIAKEKCILSVITRQTHFP